jgi:cobalt transporter subunit CbtB
MPSGVTVRREDMTTTTQTRSALRFVPALFAAALGIAVISLTGHVQAAALHDAAHDVRHATGFPCH